MPKGKRTVGTIATSIRIDPREAAILDILVGQAAVTGANLTKTSIIKIAINDAAKKAGISETIIIDAVAKYIKSPKD